MKDFFAKYFLGDRIIWVVVGFLTIVSIVSVYSSIGDMAYRSSGNTSQFLFGHLRFILVGFVLLYFVHRIPHTLFFNLSQLIITVAGILLLVTLFAGESVNEAQRWLELPGVGIKFQTSEIAKFALTIYIARILSQCPDDEEGRDSAYRKIIIPVALICGLILPSNFSTSFLVFFTSFILMFIGKIPAKRLWKTIGVLFGILVFLFLLSFVTPDTWRLATWQSRIIEFFIGTEDHHTQDNLAKTAIATSGLIGKGPGNSSVRYSLPQASSDFIFAIIIEEWGSIIGLLVVASYLIILFRTGIIVRASSRTFPAYLAIGLSINLVFQALVNMAVAVNIVPVTGQPLPLVSWGGTSMLISFLSLGIIISISRSLENQKLESAKANAEQDD